MSKSEIVAAWEDAKALKIELAELVFWLYRIDAPAERLDPWDTPEEVPLRLRSYTVRTDAILQGERLRKMVAEARDIFGRDASPVDICNLAVFCMRREVDNLMLVLTENPPSPDWVQLQKWFGSDYEKLNRAISCLEQTDEVRQELVRRARCSLLGEVKEPSRDNEATSPAAPPKPTAGSDTPVWDRDRRELSFKGKVVKRFRQPAPNQQPILDAFQEEGWPPRIDDPLPVTRGGDRRQRLADAVRGLNAMDFIRFELDGTTEGVLWKPTDGNPP